MEKSQVSQEGKVYSDGSTASYYELPEDSKQLQDLISYRNMNAQIGEIFRACYRYGIAGHSSQMRDAKKMLFYAQAEVERLEKLEQLHKDQKPQQRTPDPVCRHSTEDEIPKMKERIYTVTVQHRYGEMFREWETNIAAPDIFRAAEIVKADCERRNLRVVAIEEVVYE